MNETNNNNEINQNKFQSISNQELLDEYVRRAKRGIISQDELILAMIRIK